MESYPSITYVPARADDDPGYWCGVALDQLVAWAIDNGARADDLRERLEESIERVEKEDA